MSSTSAPNLLVFRVDAKLYATPAEEVTEVIKTPVIRSFPNASNRCLGLFNFHGRTGSLIDITINPKSSAKLRSTMLVFESENAVLAYPIDQVMRIAQFSNIDKVSNSTLNLAIPKQHLLGITQYEDERVLMLNLAALLRSEELIDLSKSLLE